MMSEKEYERDRSKSYGTSTYGFVRTAAVHVHSFTVWRRMVASRLIVSRVVSHLQEDTSPRYGCLKQQSSRSVVRNYTEVTVVDSLVF